MRVRVPKKIIRFGDLIELELEAGTWKPRGAILGVSVARNAIWVVFRPGDRATRTVMETATASGRPLRPRGRVVSITYSSSAWGEGKQRYVHEFRRHPTLWADNIKSPSILKIGGGKLSVKSDGIHG